MGSETEFSIVWWNTGCNPYGGDKVKPITEYTNVLGMLLSNYDCIFLGECYQPGGVQALARRVRHQTNKVLCFVNMYDRSGDIEHKNCVIYDKNVVISCNRKPESFYKTGSNIVENCRTGQLMHIKPKCSRQKLDIYISHWNALYDSNQKRRRVAAQDLREKINRKSASRYVVCMGDYNVEPYEAPVLDELESTRSMEFAVKRNCLFNLAWSGLSNNKGSIRINPRIYNSPMAMFDQAFVNKEIIRDFEVTFEVLRVFEKLNCGKHNPIVLKLKRKTS